MSGWYCGVGWSRGHWSWHRAPDSWWLMKNKHGQTRKWQKCNNWHIPGNKNTINYQQHQLNIWNKAMANLGKENGIFSLFFTVDFLCQEYFSKTEKLFAWVKKLHIQQDFAPPNTPTPPYITITIISCWWALKGMMKLQNCKQQCKW